MSQRVFRKDHIVGISVFLIGMTLSLLLFMSLYLSDRERLRHELDTRAIERTQVFEEELREVWERLNVVRGLLIASDGVTQEAFVTFASNVLELMPEFETLIWIEADDKDMDHNLTLVYPPREPQVVNKLAARYRDAFSKTLDSQSHSFTFPMYHESGQHPGQLNVTLIVPVNKAIKAKKSGVLRDAHLGDIVAEINISKLIETAMERFIKIPGGLDIYVYDATPSNNAQLLHFHPSRTREDASTTTASVDPSKERWHAETVLQAGGQRWRVVFTPVEKFLAPYFLLPNIFLAFGLIVSILFAGYVQTLVNRRNAVALEVKLRTTALTESEARIRSILDNALDGIISIDQHGIVQTFNPAAEKIFGFIAEDVIGNNVSMLMPEPYRSKHDGYIGSYLGGGAGKIMGTRSEVVGQRKDGTTFPMAISLSQMRVGDTLQFTGITRDITAIKEAETAIKQSEERLKRSQRFANIGSWDWDIKTGITYWSENVAPLFGLEEGEREIKHEVLRLYHEEDRERVLAAIDACINGGEEYRVEHRVVWPDGTVHWLLERGDVVRDAGNIPIQMLGVALDITQRKQAEEASARSEYRLKQFFEASTEAIFFHEDGIILDVNQGITEIFGYEPEDVLGKNLLNFVAPGSKDIAIWQMQTMDTGAIEINAVKKEGSEIPIEIRAKTLDSDSNRAKRVVTLHDISERKAAEDELRLSEERIRAIVDTVIDGIITIDNLGIVQTFNPAAEKTFGYAAAEVIGNNVSMLMPEPYHSNHDSYIANYQQGGEAKIIGSGREVVGKKKDGSTFPMELAVEKTEVSGKHMFTGVVRDISDRKQWEHNLIEAKEAAEKANNAKSQFLSSMSHELRTPLNAIMGYTQLVEYGDNLTPQQKLNLQEAYKAGNHLLELINDVLDLTKIEEDNLEQLAEPVSLEAILDECYSLTEPMTRKHGIAMEFQCKPCFIQGDHTRLKQVMLNLLSNAVKYNRAGGNVRVDCERGVKGQIRISVKDTGRGMERSHLDQLYQPFNRLGMESGDIEGTGIGLVITKRYVEMMGGNISVESTPGVGSTFSITLNEASAPSTPKHVHYPRDNEVPVITRSGRILIVEDNPTNQELFLQQMKILGHQTSVASNGEDGLGQWRSGDFDLVLSDINMPVMDGYEFVRSMRTAEHESGMDRTPVIAITANALKGEKERCLSEGMDDYLSKPVDLTQLELTLKKWIKISPNPDDSKEEAIMPDDTRQPENDSPIDPEALTRMVGDNRDMHRQLLLKFVETTPVIIQQIHTASSEKRADIVGDLGHKLKSSARAIGANELADVCQALEQAGKENNWLNIVQLDSRLDSLMDTIKIYVDQL